MVWTSKQKLIGIPTIKPRPLVRANISGRAPGITQFDFSPQDLFGACARCSHLHAINAAVATPESAIMAALIEQHVDDTNGDFAILQKADRFKDHWRSHFAGTVGAGLAYLAMIRDGYTWFDHFENQNPAGNTAVKPSPDYVFTGTGVGTALMESKGSRTASLPTFNGMVSGGYRRQVEPHLGYMVGGAYATHGYCIGSHLHSTTKAQMRIDHTAVTTPASGGGGAVAPAVQRGNYANAFTLAHSASLGAAVRAGAEVGDIAFDKLAWRGRVWLTGRVFDRLFFDGLLLGLEGLVMPPIFPRFEGRWPTISFAIEQTIAGRVLAASLGVGVARDAMPVELLRGEAGRLDGADEASPGAVFPDGLAVIADVARDRRTRLTVWDARMRRFRDTG